MNERGRSLLKKTDDEREDLADLETLQENE
jgi:hypothetical protein